RGRHHRQVRRAHHRCDRSASLKHPRGRTKPSRAVTTHHLPSIFRERVMTVTDTTSAASHTEQAVVLDPLEDAIAAFAARRAVVVVDDEDRENEIEEHTSELQSRFDLVCRLLL